MRPGFFLREALRSMRRNAVPTFAAVASVLVTTLVIGVFIPVVQATNGAANDVRGRVLVDVFLVTNDSKADVARVSREIKHAPYVHKVKFISKEQAYAQQRKLDPAAYDALAGGNPLPDTFRITPVSPDDSAKVRAELSQSSPVGTRLVTDRSIAVVKNNEGETQKILSATRVIKLTMAVLAALLIVASVLLVSNTIRLSLFSRRREVEVMKLVGATDWFIRWPFVLEGLVLGAVGGAAAVGLLALAKVTVVDSLSSSFALISHPDTINFGVLIAVLMGCAVGVSAAGSGISLRRFLRV